MEPREFSSEYPYFVKVIYAFLGAIALLSVIGLVYFSTNEEAREDVDFAIKDQLRMSYEKVSHPFWLLTIQDPDKDNDGLEDDITEKFIYETDPDVYDSKVEGVKDGDYIYEIYRNAIEAGVENSLDKFEAVYKQYDDHVVSLYDMFQWRGIQTYNSYVGISATVREPLVDAQRLRAEGKIQESIDLLEEALEENPGNPLVRYSIGRAHHGLEDYEKALSIYYELLDEPEAVGPFLYSDIAAANYGLENFDLYEEYYLRSIEEFPEELEQYLTLAGYYEGKNRLAEAEEILYQGLKVEPRYAAYYNMLAIIAGKRNNLSEEIRLYEEAVKHDFAFAAGHFNLAILYERAFNHKNTGIEPNPEDLNKALVSARIAAELHPTERHLGQLVLIYARLGKEEESAQLESELLESGLLSAGTYNSLGLLYFDREEYDKAIEFYLKALELNPDMKNPYNNLGNVYRVTDDYEKSEEYYRQAIKKDPLYLNAHKNLGGVKLDKWFAGEGSIDDLEGAVFWFEKATKLNSDDYTSFQHLGRAHLNLAQFDDSHFELAENNLKKAIEMEPNNWLSHTELGYVYYRQGMNAEAKASWQTAVSLGLEYEEINRLIEEL